MDNMIFLKAMLEYIENRVIEDITMKDVADGAGFSLSHSRAIFRKATNESLASYITLRKLNHAAFDLIHTDKKIADIAVHYYFNSHDSFSRAFRRKFGETPSVFRKNKRSVNGKVIVPGVFGPSVDNMEDGIMNENFNIDINSSTDSCILYGVPKVSYFESYEITPFISSLKACLRYMGQEISYPYLMAASGAAFRLLWNPECWDGGNVDILGFREDALEPLKRAFKASGRSFNMLVKEDSFLTKICEKSNDEKKNIKVGTKDEFIELIRKEIDNGRPVIAFGIVGPPEACIITGYKDNGDKLVGWNFFQDMPEFASVVEKEPCGYFIRKGWFEEPMTAAIISIGETVNEVNCGDTAKEILNYAYDIINTPKVNNRLSGIKAFDSWKKAITNKKEFPENAQLPMLFERLMCQTDAMAMIGEGRWCAGEYLKEVSTILPDEKNSIEEAAKLFKKEHQLVQNMAEILGGFGMGEKQASNLGKKEVRRKISELILKACKYEKQAVEKIKLGLDTPN